MEVVRVKRVRLGVFWQAWSAVSWVVLLYCGMELKGLSDLSGYIVAICKEPGHEHNVLLCSDVSTLVKVFAPILCYS